MKTVYGRIAAFFLLAGIFLFASCSDISESEGGNSRDGQAKISLNLGLKSLDETASPTGGEARTVMATSENNDSASTLTDISLYAKLSSSTATLGSGDTLLASWESYGEMQTSPYSKSLAAGSWDFMLTAKNYGATMTQTLTGKTLSAGSSTSLNFTSLSASESGEQTGRIELNLYYHPYSYADTDFKKYVTDSSTYPTISISLDSKLIATKDSKTYSLTEKTDEEGNTYEIYYSSAKFVKNSISAGFHLVTFTFTAPSDSSVFVYTVPVYVEAGYLSKDSLYPFSSTESAIKEAGVSSYTVSYNSNTASADKASQTFWAGSSIADAEALGFKSESALKRFKNWNTAADGSGSSYKAGDTPNLTGNLTLYAQWGVFSKVTYMINIDGKTDSYIQQYESTSALIESATAFADADLTYSSKSTSAKEEYTFCGWDTEADGSGTRYAAGEKPTITGDTVLYAQWCGAKLHSEDDSEYSYEGYYEVYDTKQWNALTGAPFANTSSGTISASILLRAPSSYPYSLTIDSPALKHTSGKTFSGKILGYLSVTISGLTGPLFDTVAEGAEITSLTVANCAIRGSGDYVGAICNKNHGTITNCEVTSCTIDGESEGVTYTGGICGYNYSDGTISGDSTKVTGSVKGKSTGESYTGGFCAYNEGTISGKGSVDITLSGNNEDSGCYGYAIGKESNSASTSTDITTSAQETILDTGTIEVSDYTTYKITLERTSLVSATFTDTNANAAALYGYISSSTSNSSGTPTSYYLSSGKVDASSVTKKVYLEKGTYYVFLDEGWYVNNNGCSATVTID